MMQLLLKNKKTFCIVLLLVLLLAGIRFFEQNLFYDPFLQFFKEDFQNKTLPEYDGLKLFLNLSFRYLLNTVLSVAIIYFIFKDLQLVKLTGFLYLLFFVVLQLVFFGFLFLDNPDYTVLFYVRRFLIQPLFLVLFIPAFYYQQKQVSN
ncbi:exosortase F system-associated membrane protein [Flavobacterium sp.]|uniref:exosortase F system-associated membrane protein n=1 Tax=Flavobacterium sp. TaxID=239 RepID=UPI0028BDBBF6|nr:exosortase F system-associated protein [Flavobacterium sp.]